MECDGDLTTGLDLSHSVCRQGILCILPNIDISLELRAATLIHNVGLDLCIADDGGILLAGVDSDAVASDGRVDYGGLLAIMIDKETGCCCMPWNPTLAGEPLVPWALRMTA